MPAKVEFVQICKKLDASPRRKGDGNNIFQVKTEPTEVCSTVTVTECYIGESITKLRGTTTRFYTWRNFELFYRNLPLIPHFSFSSSLLLLLLPSSFSSSSFSPSPSSPRPPPPRPPGGLRRGRDDVDPRETRREPSFSRRLRHR